MCGRSHPAFELVCERVMGISPGLGGFVGTSLWFGSGRMEKFEFFSCHAETHWHHGGRASSLNHPKYGTTTACVSMRALWTGHFILQGCPVAQLDDCSVKFLARSLPAPSAPQLNLERP
ncbi:hypothetical protein SRHO_G00204890 [Serrasalmus rhombeus]